MESSIETLKRLIEEGKAFTFTNFCIPHERDRDWGGDDTPQWITWKTRVSNWIDRLNADESPAIELASKGMSIPTRGYYQENFERSKANFILALEMTIEALQIDTFRELKSATSDSEFADLSNKVFVVHGHDKGLKTEVESFIGEIGLEPIVLHRQPDKGRTIIEKFEENSDVGYVFVLLTPDDLVYSAVEEQKIDEERNKEFRARPNVIFEFGYFVGKLGRGRVCCLFKEGVTLPSDIDGLIYKKVGDSLESQKFSIIKELTAAGYNIQM